MKKKFYLCVLVAAVWIASRSGVLAQHHEKGDGGFQHVHTLATDPQGQTLFLGAHTGLFKSEDGGRSWNKVELPAEGSHHLDIMAVTPHPKDSRIIYIGTHEAGVFKSTDGGKTWREINTGLGGLDVHGLAIDPNDGKLHALVREKGEGVYRSANGGAKWTRVDDGPGGEVKVLASVNISTGMGGIWLYAGTAEGLQRNPDCF